MKIDFEFDNQFVPQNVISIDRIDNFCLEAINETNLFYYYLMIKTEMGMSEIFTYGPIVPDIPEPLDFYSYSYQKIKYNDKKICSFIDKWLNDRMKGITTASIINVRTFLENTIDLNVQVSKYLLGEEIQDGEEGTD